MDEKKQEKITSAKSAAASASSNAADKSGKKSAVKKKTAAKKKPVSKTSDAAHSQGNTIFALDIGTRSVVGILAEKTSGGYKVTAMETAAHETRSMKDGQIEDIAAVSEVIKKVKAALEKRCSVKLSKVCIAAAGRTLRTTRASWEYSFASEKTLTEKDIRDAELEAVRRTSEQFSSENETSAFYCVGHSVISLTLDNYRVTMPVGHRGEKLETEIIAAFLPAYVVESLCAAVDKAGLETAGLTLEPIAAMNVVVPPELRLINIALCDIGAGTSDVAVSRDGSVVAYGMATNAGDEITESLMKLLLVDFATAERIKTCGEAEISYTDILLQPHTITAKKLAELLLPMTEELAETIASEILAANLTPPQAVFLVGGGSKLSGLAELVAEKLGLDATRVVVGRRELMRGITAPDHIKIDAEHATPLGIAVTSDKGISYDFTTITLNGKKIRALGTTRLTVFELLRLDGITPEALMGKSGGSLCFTLNGEQITLRGAPAKPAEITVDGKPAALNSNVHKGDEITVAPAENGSNAAAKLSDYIKNPASDPITVTLFGEEWSLKRHIFVNGKEVSSDRAIHNGDEIAERRTSLGELLTSARTERAVLLNGEEMPPETLLNDGDVITAAEPTAQPIQQDSSGIAITFNGISSTFPLPDDNHTPIFLDIASAFSDDPTALLSNSSVITVNGKVARLDEEIHNGDVIVIE